MSNSYDGPAAYEKALGINVHERKLVAKGHSYVKSPIQYLGCKYRMLPELIPAIGPCSHFIDVFGGSGTVIANVNAVHRQYNDADMYLTNHIKTIAYDPTRFMKLMKSSIRSRRDYERARLTMQVHTEDFLLVNTLSVIGKGMSFARNMRGSVHRPPASVAPTILQWATLMHGAGPYTAEDYSDVFDAADVFVPSLVTDKLVLYCDPPYSGTEQPYKGGRWSVNDDANLIARIKHCKHRVVLSCYGGRAYDSVSWDHVIRLQCECLSQHAANTAIRKQVEEVIYIHEASE